MNMFGTGNREEDELLRLLRQGLITPEQLQDMSAGQQAARELRGSASDTLTPMGSRRDGAVRAAASLQPETTAMAQAPAQRASTPMESRSEGIKERGLEDLLKDRASTVAPMLDQRSGGMKERGLEDLLKGRASTATPMLDERRETTLKAPGLQPETTATAKATVQPDLQPMASRSEDMEEPSLTGAVERGLLPGEEGYVEPIRPPSRMSQVADYLKENPDVAAAGLQSIGSLIANIGMARGQKKADEKTQERTARANLIGAITSGRARPQVQAETPDAGFLGQLGSGLATAGKLGSDLIKQRNVMDLKEGELQRKVAADAVRAARVAAQNKMTDAQIEDLIARQTLAMTAEERKRFEAEFRKQYGIDSLELKREEQDRRFNLDVQKFENKVLGDEFLRNLQREGQDIEERNMALKEAYFGLDEADKKQAWDLAIKRSNLDEKKFVLDKELYEFKKEEAKFKRDEAMSEASSKARAELRGIINKDLNGDILKRYVDSQNGLFPTYDGLNAAYSNFVDDSNAANMNAVFQMYQRLFDPATVREGDLELQKRGQGMVLDIIASAERLDGGGFVLAKEQIENMKDVSDQYIASAREKANERLGNYIDNVILGEGATATQLRQADALRAYYAPIFGDPMTQGGGTGGGRTGTAGADFVGENYSDE